VINLAHAKRLDLLARIRGFEFIVPDVVVELEVIRETQTRSLQEALTNGWMRQTSVDGDERMTYAELRKFMGRGEAACLAIAKNRGWLLACDDSRRVPSYVRKHLGEGRIVNTPGLLLLAIRLGALSLDEADSIKAILERNRFKMNFKSFRDVVSKSIERA